jgi:uncharacterized protein (TIGR00255 family)
MTSPLHPGSPVYSMTGFARVMGRVSESLGFSLTLKSVNHRFLDPHLRIPSGLESVEMQIRRLLKEKLVRGHIEVIVSLERSARPEAQYNHVFVASYVAAFRAAQQELALPGEPDLNTILRLPGALTADQSSSLEDAAALESEVIKQLNVALASLNEMRAQEGQSLVRELHGTLDRLGLAVSSVAELRPEVERAYLERLNQRLSELLNGTFERERVLQEAALVAERSDVEEEIARLHTHIDHFRSLLNAGGEIGKKLDFLLQEMNREANTLLSKTTGVAGKGTKITELGLAMKSEIEKAREQVQNIE